MAGLDWTTLNMMPPWVRWIQKLQKYKKSKVFGGETPLSLPLSLSLSLSLSLCMYIYVYIYIYIHRSSYIEYLKNKNSCSLLGGHWSSCMRSWPNWSSAGAGQNVTANCGWCFVQRTSLRSGCSLEARSGNLSSSRYSRWIYRRARDHLMYHDFAITWPITLLSMPGPVSINGVSMCFPHIKLFAIIFSGSFPSNHVCHLLLHHFSIINMSSSWFPSSSSITHLSVHRKFPKLPTHVPAIFPPFSRHFAHVIPLTLW